MILADYHIHTEFSEDSTAPMERMIERAISLGLKRICFTDHMDYDYPKKEITNPDGTITRKTIFYLDVPAYRKRLKELAHRYRGQIDVRFGIEMGLIDSGYELYHSLLREYPFDFNIASSHLVDKTGPYFPEYWERFQNYHGGVCRYFESILEHLAVFQDFDTYGHLDYVIRFVPEPDKRSYAYEEYAELLDAVLLRLIELDKALEVNTGGYKNGLGVPNPQPEVLKRYRELGGEKITIGSDAHITEHMAYGFGQCQELLESLGYRYYAVYEGHKAQMWKLS